MSGYYISTSTIGYPKSGTGLDGRAGEPLRPAWFGDDEPRVQALDHLSAPRELLRARPADELQDRPRGARHFQDEPRAPPQGRQGVCAVFRSSVETVQASKREKG